MLETNDININVEVLKMFQSQLQGGRFENLLEMSRCYMLIYQLLQFAGANTAEKYKMCKV